VLLSSEDVVGVRCPFELAGVVQLQKLTRQFVFERQDVVSEQFSVAVRSCVQMTDDERYVDRVTGTDLASFKDV